MINLQEYAPIVVGDDIARAIYEKIKLDLLTNEIVEVDISAIKLMVTKCSKMIFGQLYQDLGKEDFFERIHIHGASENIKAVIRAGIQLTIEENTK